MEVRDKKYIKTHRNFIDVPIFGDFFIGGHPGKSFDTKTNYQFKNSLN